jgi:hypothetical protein
VSAPEIKTDAGCIVFTPDGRTICEHDMRPRITPGGALAFDLLPEYIKGCVFEQMQMGAVMQEAGLIENRPFDEQSIAEMVKFAKFVIKEQARHG